MHAVMPDSGSSSCFIPPVSLLPERWIALVDKGGCKLAFILNAPVLRNASAIVIYSHDDMQAIHSRRLKCKQVLLVHVVSSNSSSGSNSSAQSADVKEFGF